ncbi:MAG: nucleotide disphospho-sugar-binding domain-containing protein [Pseudomonadota bacterium]
MARIVVVPHAIRSKLVTVTELTSRLEASGHDVTLVAPRDGRMDDSGLPYQPSGLRLVPVKVSSSRWRPVRAWHWLTGRRKRRAAGRAAVADAGGERFEQTLRALAPDLVLVDIEMPEHLLVAAANGFRVVQLCVFFSLWRHPNVPPLHVRMTPSADSAASQWPVTFAWWRYYARRWWELKMTVLHGADQSALLHQFAEQLNYPLVRVTDAYQGLIPLVFSDVDLLNTNLWELELPHDRLPRHRYVGPMVARQRSTLRFDVAQQAANARVDALIDKVKSADPDARLIYCAFGGYFHGDETTFWSELLAAVGQKPQWSVILGLGGRVDKNALPTVPANVHVFAWAPQMRVLEHADAAVIHGGMTSVYECLDNAVPMLVYPFDHFDQFGTAARVEYHGVGLVGDRRRDRAPQIVARLDTLLASTAVRERVAVYREYIRRDRANATLDRAIIELLQRSPGDAPAQVVNA